MVFLSVFLSGNRGVNFPKIFVVRTSLSLAVTLRQEGQVELRGETPNGLSASATLANGDRQCQYYFCEWLLPTPKMRWACLGLSSVVIIPPFTDLLFD